MKGSGCFSLGRIVVMFMGLPTKFTMQVHISSRAISTSSSIGSSDGSTCSGSVSGSCLILLALLY